MQADEALLTAQLVLAGALEREGVDWRSAEAAGPPLVTEQSAPGSWVFGWRREAVGVVDPGAGEERVQVWRATFDGPIREVRRYTRLGELVGGEVVDTTTRRPPGLNEALRRLEPSPEARWN